jgi:hypothetical protein
MQKLFITIFLSAILITNLAFGKKVNIIYTANINATYKDCNCGSKPLGGLDRIKTYIDEFRSKNKQTLLIDGGNYFNSYSFIELNEIALQSLSFLNYDLLTPGVHVFLENQNFYKKYSKKYNNKIINSNTNLYLNKYKDIQFSEIKIRFFGFVSPDLFKYTHKPEWLSLSYQINKLEYLNDGLNIVIYNGYLSDAQEFLNKYNRFDALLLSSDQQTGTWKSGHTIIIGGGHDAESIALIEISVGENSKKITVNYIDMDDSIQPNENIVKLFDVID